MKWASSLLLLAALCRAAPASGQHGAINLFWDDCGASGSLRKTFACDTNTGAHVLVGSFIAPGYLVSVSGWTASLELQSACPAYPDWWKMRTGYCRNGSLNSSFDFTSGPTSCFDYWQGGAMGMVSMDDPAGRGAVVTLQCAWPVLDPRAGPIEEGTHVYAFKMVVNNAKTVGPGSCAGCQDDLCLVLKSILIHQTPGTPEGDRWLGNPDLSQVAAWQGGSWSWNHLQPGGVCTGDCPTPVRARTWGQIKSLYR